MNCLWCDQIIIIEATWSNLFFPPKKQYLCQVCNNALDILSGRRCLQCSRTTTKKVCSDCIKWQNKNDSLTFNYSIYDYNERMQDMITKWKYRGDYVIGLAFQEMFREVCKEKFGNNEKYTIIPIPLSQKRMRERGFNQAAMLAGFLTPNPREVLTRVHGEKQSKKTRKERINAKNPFELTESLNNPVILVDDIYTTGTTLRLAAEILKQAGCPTVYGLTLVRG